MYNNRNHQYVVDEYIPFSSSTTTTSISVASNNTTPISTPTRQKEQLQSQSQSPLNRQYNHALPQPTAQRRPMQHRFTFDDTDNDDDDDDNDNNDRNNKNHTNNDSTNDVIGDTTILLPLPQPTTTAGRTTTATTTATLMVPPPAAASSSYIAKFQQQQQNHHQSQRRRRRSWNHLWKDDTDGNDHPDSNNNTTAAAALITTTTDNHNATTTSSRNNNNNNSHGDSSTIRGTVRNHHTMVAPPVSLSLSVSSSTVVPPPPQNVALSSKPFRLWNSSSSSKTKGSNNNDDVDDDDQSHIILTNNNHTTRTTVVSRRSSNGTTRPDDTEPTRTTPMLTSPMLRPSRRQPVLAAAAAVPESSSAAASDGPTNATLTFRNHNGPSYPLVPPPPPSSNRTPPQSRLPRNNNNNNNNHQNQHQNTTTTTTTVTSTSGLDNNNSSNNNLNTTNNNIHLANTSFTNMDEYFSKLMMMNTPSPTKQKPYHYQNNSQNVTTNTDTTNTTTCMQPISPFSKTSRRRKRPTTTTTTMDDQRHPPQQYISLSTCRKVSVLLSIRSDPRISIKQHSLHDDDDGHDPAAAFLFPAPTLSTDVTNKNSRIDDNNDEFVVDSRTTASFNHRELMVVNPTAFLGNDTKNLLWTTQQLAQLTHQSSSSSSSTTEDWTQIYVYHHILWWSVQQQQQQQQPMSSAHDSDHRIFPTASPSATTADVVRAAVETMHNISQAIVNDIIAPGSIAHRIVIGTATTTAITPQPRSASASSVTMTAMELQQTQQLFGHIGQQSIARVLASSSPKHAQHLDDAAITDMFQQFGIAGLTVHGILQRISQWNNNSNNGTTSDDGDGTNNYYYCTVSILEISTEGDDMLYDLLASRPFAKTKPHNGTVTLRYNPDNEYSGKLATSKSTSSSSGSTNGPIFSVTGLSETSIDSVKQFGHLIRRAYTAALHTNRSTKRGHIIVTIHVHCGGCSTQSNTSTIRNNGSFDRSTQRSTTTTSCQFVDLAMAGCEDDKSSKENYKQLNNGSSHSNHRRRNVMIRKSLLALSGVLRGMLLKESGNDVPISFRESMLTKVLQRSMIQSDSRTILMATVAPEIRSYEETMTTLRYVNRLLHRPGQMIQSPFASGTFATLSSPTSSPFPKQPDSESVATSLLSLTEVAGKGRLLKEIVSDPRQRLAKVLQPINQTFKSELSPLKPQLEKIRDPYVLEEYVPSTYTDPEEEVLQDPSNLAPSFHDPKEAVLQDQSNLVPSSHFLSSPLLPGKLRNPSFSPREREDLVEIVENDDDHHAAPTPPTRNVTIAATISHVTNEVAGDHLSTFHHDNDAHEHGDDDEYDTDNDNNMSAIYEVFGENAQRNYGRPNAVDRNSNVGRNAEERTNPFDDNYDGNNFDIDSDYRNVLNESHTLDFMAMHVMGNQMSANFDGIPESDRPLLERLNRESAIEENEVTRTNFHSLEKILRAGAGEEEVVFTESIAPEKTTEAEAMLDPPSYDVQDDGFDRAQTMNYSTQTIDFLNSIYETSDEVPSLVSEKDSHVLDTLQKHQSDEHSKLDQDVLYDDFFSDPDVKRMTFRDHQSKMHIDANEIPNGTVHKSDSEVDEPLTIYDLPPESPADGTIGFSDIHFAMASGQVRFNQGRLSHQDETDISKTISIDTEHGIDTMTAGQKSTPQLSDVTDLSVQNHSNILSWKPSPIDHRQASPHWNKTVPTDEATILSNDASQKVQDEIDQLQAAVNKVKQTNINVWQSSLESINNLRFFQTAHQEALAQLLVEKEVASKEIQRLDAELNRRSEEHYLSTIQYEEELESAASKIAKVELDRGEVVKIAEEAIGIQSELEQKVADLERNMKEIVASSVPRQDYEGLESITEVLKEELHECKDHLSSQNDELDESHRTITQLEVTLAKSETVNCKLLDEVTEVKNEVLLLNELLRDEQSAKNDAITSADEKSKLIVDLRASEENHRGQLQDMQRENILKDEYTATCRKEVDASKMELHNLQEEANAKVTMLQDEISNLRQELEQLERNYSDYPVKLNSYEREFSSLQNERSNLIHELEQAKTSLHSRVADVRDLSESLKELLSEKESDAAKILRMQNALTSFQEETRSRLEIVVGHRNEAASLLEKTVSENKSLVDVNVELQKAIQLLQEKRSNAELQIQERDSNVALEVENVTNENRALTEANQHLLLELEELRRRYSMRRDNNETNEQNFRNAFQPRFSHSRHDDQYAYTNSASHRLDERPLEYDNRRVDDNDFGNGVQNQAEVVAAHLAVTAKSLMEQNLSETVQLKEKIYNVEDDTDYEIHALKTRMKQLERRISSTTTSAATHQPYHDR